MIKTISVKNFKSFKNTGKISVGKSTILISSNNTEKNNFTSGNYTLAFGDKNSN